MAHVSWLKFNGWFSLAEHRAASRASREKLARRREPRSVLACQGVRGMSKSSPFLPCPQVALWQSGGWVVRLLASRSGFGLGYVPLSLLP